MDILSLPFNEFLGLQLSDVEGRQVISLAPQHHHQNHIGTVHAGVIYSVAEAASGHALLTQTDLPVEDVLAVVRSANVKYRKPAAGKLTASGTIKSDNLAKFQSQFAERGRSFVNVDVRVSSAEGDVMSAEFQWYVSHQSGNAANPST